jgi:aminobenzoyl-glutamate utilization protein B
MKSFHISIGLFLLAITTAIAQEPAEYSFLEKDLDANTEKYTKVARQIWENPELGYLESKSSQLLINLLKDAGFQIKAGIAGMPTSFEATFDRGGSTIGFLAEYDALPGLSQDAVGFPKPVTEDGHGHGCGHNLFGTASVASAIALKNWVVANKASATIKLFGTPAEEGGAGKVYMVRDGVFEDVDVMINWHPADHNDASPMTCTAVIQGVFTFKGLSAHAAMSPQYGRSALDGVEAMNHMVNLMREHVDQESRMHYVITKGGKAANVVPDLAQVEYIVRHPDVSEVKRMWQRVIKAANGAAEGTETTVEYEVISGIYGLLPNEVLAKVMQKNLEKVGGVEYNESEMEFAKEIQASINASKLPKVETANAVRSYRMGHFAASTDVGDVSYVVPTVGLATATWVPGTPPHSWQAVACNGMSIGFKGMMVAAKSMAFTGLDLIKNPLLIEAAKKEFEERLEGLKYESLVGDRKPPLDFRVGR